MYFDHIHIPVPSLVPFSLSLNSFLSFNFPIFYLGASEFNWSYRNMGQGLFTGAWTPYQQISH